MKALYDVLIFPSLLEPILCDNQSKYYPIYKQSCYILSKKTKKYVIVNESVDPVHKTSPKDS